MESNNTIAPVMPHAFTGSSDNKPQVFDLSRLRRRAPDLSTVKPSRFMFQTWEIRDAKTNALISESEWDRNITNTHTFKLVLRHHDNRYVLEVVYCATTDSRFLEKTRIGIGWNIKGYALCRHAPIVISTLPYMKFEALVKQVEAFMLRACSKFDYEVIRSPDPEIRDFDAYSQHVNACLAQWRGVKSESTVFE